MTAIPVLPGAKYYDETLGLRLAFETTHVESLCAELEPRGEIDPAEPLRTTPWSATHFGLCDIDGNPITFTTPA